MVHNHRGGQNNRMVQIYLVKTYHRTGVGWHTQSIVKRKNTETKHQHNLLHSNIVIQKR